MSQLQQQGYHRQSLPKDWHLYSTEGSHRLIDCIKCYVEVCYFEVLRSRSLKFTHMAHMCGGLKQVWGDQNDGGPENLLALRAEGTRVSS